MSSGDALFADSSSDEDEGPDTAPQDDPKDEVETRTQTEKPSEDAQLTDKVDDDKESEDETKEVSKDETGSTSKKRPSIFGDDSDDEDDAEFDDDGAIQGSAAPAEPKATETTESNEAPDSTPTTKSSNKPPEKVTVLHAERPDESVTLHMTKLPNLVAVQPAAFDETAYIAQEEEEQYKGYVHNMIRWRYKRDGDGELMRDSKGGLVRESNTKIVKWDDGSFTLHIGGETFDIQNVDGSQKEFAGLNGYLYLSQKATFGYNDDEEAGTGTVLECVGPINSRLIPKPSSLQSEAHKSLTVAVRQRTIKRAKIAEYVTQEDPEKLKADRIRTNEEEDKIRARKKASYRSSTSRRVPGMNRRYMEDDEDDEDYDTTNISAMKKGMAMEDDMDDYGDESDDDGYEDTFRSRSRKKQKRALEEEDEEEEELDFDNEDDEDDVAVIKAHKKKPVHQAVLDDDDSD